jgi:hypothetical protein
MLLVLLLVPATFASADFTKTYYPENSDYCGAIECPYDVDAKGDKSTIEFDVSGYEHREIISKTYYVRANLGGCRLEAYANAGFFLLSQEMTDLLNVIESRRTGCNESYYGDETVKITAYGKGSATAQGTIFCSAYLKVVYGDFCSAPSNLNAYKGVNEVSLNWSAMSADVTYNIYWSTSQGVSKTKYAGKFTDISGTSFVHTGLVNGTTYYYVITAEDDKGESPISNEDDATPREQDACYPLPDSGNWVVSSDCILYDSYTAPANVEVQNGAVLTILDGVTLDIDLINYNLTVRNGSGVLIRYGGKID